MTARSLTLGELVAEGGGDIQTGPFGSQLHASDYVDVGIPSVMPQNIGDNVIHTSDIARISEHDAQRLARYRLRTGDIVYSRRGDVERRALVRPVNDGWLCGTGCLRVRLGDRSTTDPRFLSYLLGVPETRTWIVQHAVGATMLNLNTSILSSVPLRVPHATVQRAVANVLGALDDKITANTALARTADELMRARFDDLARSSTDTVSLQDLVQFPRLTTLPSSEAIPYVGLEHVPRRLMWLTDWGDSSEVSSAKSEFAQGDILFGKLRPYFHKVVSAPIDGICSTDIIVCRPADTSLGGFCLAALASDQVVAEVSASAEGTRMPRTRWQDLGATTVPWPGETTARRISQESMRLRDLCDSLASESRTLAELRDTLLPRLMSGELTVRDAEVIAEDAT